MGRGISLLTLLFLSCADDPPDDDDDDNDTIGGDGDADVDADADGDSDTCEAVVAYDGSYTGIEGCYPQADDARAGTTTGSPPPTLRARLGILGVLGVGLVRVTPRRRPAARRQGHLHHRPSRSGLYGGDGGPPRAVRRPRKGV